MVEQPSLRFEEDKLTKLANDLNGMQTFLDQQVERMDRVVDGIEAKWQGSTAAAYRDLHRGAAEDAVRIRLILHRLEQAVRLSRDGFSEQDLEIMVRMRQVQSSVDVRAEVDKLSTPNSDGAAPRTHSRIHDL
ncbi:WXG100 family type VII secretion target [Streptomyces sp. NPDC006197]|uniref:WXG100 family type VII secretion target n=1 Tax=Streptomyces sp. NPDC006197 TaxID=3156685 RepID=UPI0033BB623A